MLNEKSYAQIIIIFYFTFKSANFVRINLLLINIQQIYDFKIMFEITFEKYGPNQKNIINIFLIIFILQKYRVSGWPSQLGSHDAESLSDNFFSHSEHIVIV